MPGAIRVEIRPGYLIEIEKGFDPQTLRELIRVFGPDMFGISRHSKVYLSLGSTDLRKSINTLSLLVQGGMKLDPFCGHYFGFCNRRRNLLKVLYWDRNGFCLWQKRLERDRFHWPIEEEDILEIGEREFLWLCEGLKLEQVKGHSEFKYATVL